jgi:hypothetical protein
LVVSFQGVGCHDGFDGWTLRDEERRSVWRVSFIASESMNNDIGIRRDDIKQV